MDSASRESLSVVTLGYTIPLEENKNECYR